MSARVIEVTPAYAAAREDAVVVSRDDRVLLRAHGRDPVKMIQGLITNDLENAGPDRVVYGAMLTPKGRMIADLRALRQPDGAVLLDFDAGAVDAARAHLKKMVPPLFARFDEPAPPLRVVGVYGQRAAEHLRALGIDVADDAAEYGVVRAQLAGGVAIAVATRELGVPGFDVVVAGENAAWLRAQLEGAGVRGADVASLDVLRIEAGRPRWGAELDEERIPLEADLLERGISTSKGCYTGQEVVIRILHRGHVNWQLRGLLLGEAAPPERGTELVADDGGKTVARVTSATRSPARGETIALAYVRREIEPGRALRLPDGGTATVVELPFTKQMTETTA